MNEPQIWAVIGVMITALFAMPTLMATMFTRVIRSEIGRLEGKFDGLRGEMNARFDLVDVKFDMVNARIDSLQSKVDNMDRDVQFLMDKEADR